MLLDDRMRLRYWLRRDLNEDQSREEWYVSSRFSMADSRAKSSWSRSEPRVGFRVTAGEFG